MTNNQKYQIDCARDELQKAADLICEAGDFLMNAHNPQELDLRFECQILIETLRNISVVDMNLERM